MSNFKKAVKVAAAQKGLRLQDVAAELNMCGSSFSRMMNGNPTKDSMDNVANFFELKTHELLALGE